MRVELTPQAYDGIAEMKTSSPSEVRQLRSASFSGFSHARRLEDLGFARLGRKVPELDVDDYREVLEGTYRIVYRIRDDALVQIVTVFDGRRGTFPFIDLLDGE